MKTTLSALVLISLLWGPLCQAQTSPPAEANDWKPSTLNQPGQQYPQVNSEGRARFRIVAPQAQSVSVGLGGRDYPDQRRGRRLGRHHGADRWMKASTTTISRLMGGHLTIPAP